MGAFFVDPEEGMLACGYAGKGRLASIKKIEEAIVTLAKKRKEFAGIKVIVTSGGTEEEIDPVRVITNKSSGKMGARIAEELSMRGAEVTIIRTRRSVQPTTKMNEVIVSSATEMLTAIKKNISKNGMIIHAAAVSDFKVKKQKSKISSKSGLKLELIPNIKIISQIKRMKKDIFLVGFKAEHGSKSLLRKAKETLETNECNMVIANDISKGVFNSDYNSGSGRHCCWRK